MKRWLRGALIGLIAIGPLSPCEEQRDSFDLTVPQPPIPVATEDHIALVYELHLTNFAAEPLRFQKLRVIDPDNRNTIASFEGSDLANRFALVGGSADRE